MNALIDDGGIFVFEFDHYYAKLADHYYKRGLVYGERFDTGESLTPDWIKSVEQLYQWVEI